MQIRVSSGDCRAAVTAATQAIVDILTADRATLSEKSLEALRTGAEHNGLDVNAARLQEMKEMVERDVDHTMGRHPANETLEVLKNFSDMLSFHQAADVVIDDQDFHLLKKHLPEAKEDPALKAKDNYD